MAETKKKTVFNTLRDINVNEHTETKQGLTYLSWAWAWDYVKSLYPDATYTIHTFGEDEMPYQYTDSLGYMVWTSVTIEGETLDMWLPVMDGANKSMKAMPYTYTVKRGEKTIEKTVEAATMFDINKTIMRCLVKNLGMFGLGLYIYSGEDLPEVENKAEEELKEAISKINKLGAELVKKGLKPDDIYKVVEELNDGNKNPNNIKDLEVAKKVFEKMSTLVVEKKTNTKKKGDNE